MNAPSPALAATETHLIEDALDALLTAAEAYQSERSLQPDKDGPRSAAAVTMEVIERMQSWTKAQQEAAEFLRRPVSEALRQAVTKLGERLFEIGGLKAMQDALDHVAARDPVNEGRRIGIMDHRWDGIGGQWWA